MAFQSTCKEFARTLPLAGSAAVCGSRPGSTVDVGTDGEADTTLGELAGVLLRTVEEVVAVAGLARGVEAVVQPLAAPHTAATVSTAVRTNFRL
jgi:hypothetical protein